MTMHAERERLETQVRRLTESIDGKWTRLVKESTKYEEDRCDVCPLCVEYQGNSFGSIIPAKCKACPLGEDGLRCLQAGSPYKNWRENPCLDTTLAMRDALVASRAVRVERLRVMKEKEIEDETTEVDIMFEAERVFEVNKELRAQLHTMKSALNTTRRVYKESRSRAERFKAEWKRVEATFQHVRSERDILKEQLEVETKRRFTAQNKAEERYRALHVCLSTTRRECGAMQSKLDERGTKSAKMPSDDHGTLAEEMDRLYDRPTSLDKDLADALRPVWEAIRVLSKHGEHHEGMPAYTAFRAVLNRAIELIGKR